MKRKKIERSFVINYHLNWTCGVSIEQLKEDIKKLEELGVTEIEISSNDSIDIIPSSRRMETDEEYDFRIAREREIYEAQKERDLKLLQTLKAKYEK